MRPSSDGVCLCISYCRCASGALWFLGARIGQQRQKRGRNSTARAPAARFFLHLVLPPPPASRLTAGAFGSRTSASRAIGQSGSAIPACLSRAGECCSAPRPKRATPPDPRSAESSVWISDAADWYSRAICRKRARPAVVLAARASSKQRAAYSGMLGQSALIERKMLIARRRSLRPVRQGSLCDLVSAVRRRNQRLGSTFPRGLPPMLCHRLHYLLGSDGWQALVTILQLSPASAGLFVGHQAEVL